MFGDVSGNRNVLKRTEIGLGLHDPRWPSISMARTNIALDLCDHSIRRVSKTKINVSGYLENSSLIEKRSRNGRRLVYPTHSPSWETYFSKSGGIKE